MNCRIHTYVYYKQQATKQQYGPTTHIQSIKLGSSQNGTFSLKRAKHCEID